MNSIRTFLHDERGASAVEFVLVVPILALFIFGAIDVGIFAWRINLAEKATQAGVRLAVVTAPVASGLTAENYVNRNVGGTIIRQGDVIPAAALTTVTCDNATCSPCPASGLTSCTRDATAFTRIVDRMRVYDRTIQAANVLVEYRGSGLGFAGDPSGMQIAPLVTVRLRDMRYTPMVGYIFNGGIALPDFASSLTMEDGSGANSN